MRFRGENPVYKRMEYARDDSDTATYTGVAFKTIILLLVAAANAFLFAGRLTDGFDVGTLIGGLIAAPIIAIIMMILAHRMPALSWFFSLLYAIFEGAFLGLISTFAAFYAGSDVVVYALMGTFGSLATMLFLFSTGIVRVGNKFRSFMFTALIGIVLASLIFWISTFFGVFDTSFGYSIYITIVVASVIIASLFLLVDFDRIERYIEGGVSKDHEWSLALGLMVTIVWLYVEMLRLAMIIMGRRK